MKVKQAFNELYELIKNLCLFVKLNLIKKEKKIIIVFGTNNASIAFGLVYFFNILESDIKRNTYDLSEKIWFVPNSSDKNYLIGIMKELKFEYDKRYEFWKMKNSLKFKNSDNIKKSLR